MGFIATLGYQARRIAIKCDNELSIRALREALMQQAGPAWFHKTPPQWGRANATAGQSAQC